MRILTDINLLLFGGGYWFVPRALKVCTKNERKAYSRRLLLASPLFDYFRAILARPNSWLAELDS
jgi:hypothetical protein